MADDRLRRIAEIEIALFILAEQVREAENGLRPFPTPVPTGGFEAADERVKLIHRYLTALLRALDQTGGVAPVIEEHSEATAAP